MAYTSQYPTLDSDHVKTTNVSGDTNVNNPLWCVDPAKSLTGNATNNGFIGGAASNRISLDLGSAKIIRRIYLENYHSDGNTYGVGIETFYFQGSNSESSFLETTYATNTGWTDLTCSIAAFAQHVSADQADPQYATVTNTTAFRYYSLKVEAASRGCRRLELQTEDGFVVATRIPSTMSMRKIG